MKESETSCCDTAQRSRSPHFIYHQAPWDKLRLQPPPEDNSHRGSSTEGIAEGALPANVPLVTPLLGAEQTLLEYIKDIFRVCVHWLILFPHAF